MPNELQYAALREPQRTNGISKLNELKTTITSDVRQRSQPRKQDCANARWTVIPVRYQDAWSVAHRIAGVNAQMERKGREITKFTAICSRRQLSKPCTAKIPGFDS